MNDLSLSGFVFLNRNELIILSDFINITKLYEKKYSVNIQQKMFLGGELLVPVIWPGFLHHLTLLGCSRFLLVKLLFLFLLISWKNVFPDEWNRNRSSHLFICIEIGNYFKSFSTKICPTNFGYWVDLLQSMMTRLLLYNFLNYLPLSRRIMIFWKGFHFIVIIRE